jgi:hypothetical protein
MSFSVGPPSRNLVRGLNQVPEFRPSSRFQEKLPNLVQKANQVRTDVGPLAQGVLANARPAERLTESRAMPDSRDVTRILRKPVACPRCGHVQTASIMYSWNERLSGPYSEERFRITCESCAEPFIPHPSDIRHVERPGVLRRLIRRIR